ncbi:T9SS C-terminal target domain-containing protein [Bacteroidetes/Chlorobi group bacterium ChocPot_Mid]|nr:MAG: T9SS C-terminal target domain-containing protein [Bacteroidetes/Chlorobi group bacterium ChocPot_Mid]
MIGDFFMKKDFALLILIAFFMSAFLSSTNAQTSVLQRSVIGSGGAVDATNADTHISGILGQTAIFTVSQSGQENLHQGFWVPYEEPGDVEEKPITLSNELINYPNPFSYNTTIKYTLTGTGSTTLRIYDMIGRLRKTFELGVQSSGAQEIVWDGKDEEGIDCPAGSYTYELTVNGYRTDFSAVQKDLNLRNVMVIVR